MVHGTAYDTPCHMHHRTINYSANKTNSYTLLANIETLEVIWSGLDLGCRTLRSHRTSHLLPGRCLKICTCMSVDDRYFCGWGWGGGGGGQFLKEKSCTAKLLLKKKLSKVTAIRGGGGGDEQALSPTEDLLLYMLKKVLDGTPPPNKNPASTPEG